MLGSGNSRCSGKALPKRLRIGLSGRNASLVSSEARSLSATNIKEDVKPRLCHVHSKLCHTLKQESGKSPILSGKLGDWERDWERYSGKTKLSLLRFRSASLLVQRSPGSRASRDLAASAAELRSRAGPRRARRPPPGALGGTRSHKRGPGPLGRARGGGLPTQKGPLFLCASRFCCSFVTWGRQDLLAS